MNKNKIAEGIRMILEAIGEDPQREGLKETPERIAKMYEELFSGIHKTPEKYLSKTFDIASKDVVLEKDIPFYSMCEHHLLPFYGVVHIAYIPNGKVVGLSKLGRTVDTYAKRPQLQEKLTRDIGNALMRYLDALGVMVIIQAEHLCMNMRGIKKPGTKTLTCVKDGVFATDQKLTEEVYHLLRVG